MSKKACSLDKKEKKKLRNKPANYVCEKCKATAHKPKRLCKPEKSSTL